ncbi:MAG: hypothetical protein ACKO0Z_08045 [Betaproteobacteria bacterium]
MKPETQMGNILALVGLINQIAPVIQSAIQNGEDISDEAMESLFADLTRSRMELQAAIEAKRLREVNQA